MTDMILYLAMATAGYILASKIQDKKDKFWWTGKVQTIAIVCLVLLMGMRMGSNQEIIDNIGTIGLSALIMTIVIMAFSVALIIIARIIMRIDRYGNIMTKEEASEIKERKKKEKLEGKTKEKPKRELNKMTIIILVCVIVGMVFGYLVIKPMFEGRMDDFVNFASRGIQIGLCVLIFLVGMDLGFVGHIFKSMKEAGIRVLIIPIVILFGSLVGGVISGTVLGFSIKESLAIAGGLGWYSLAPGIIMEAGYITASAVSFLHNVFRETFTILLVPTIAKRLGYVETIAMAASPAMDVCLPIIERSTAPHVAVYSFISGAFLSIMVPIVVSLFIGL